MMPINLFSASTTGRPEILNLAINSLASAKVWSLVRVTGSEIIPFSERFTRFTCDACSEMGIFL